MIISEQGFDLRFLHAFRKLILDCVSSGDRFILVIGGGYTARAYQRGLSSLIPTTKETLDWIGIASTVLNANFVRLAFGGNAHHDVVVNPTKKVRTVKPIVCAAGWKPGCSTDNDAVLLAKTYGAKEIINLSNIDFVYTKDPKKYPDAKKIVDIDWSTFRKNIVGSAATWEPGRHVPFDPVASAGASKLGLTVKMVNGSKLAEVKKAIGGTVFLGTTIHP